MGNDSPQKFDPNALSAEDRHKLDSGKPLTPIPGVKITKNPITGKYEGVPKEWVDNYGNFINVDQNKMVSTKHLPKQIRPDEDLPEAIL